jgi:putative addiction module component (TIGR02574 family)
MTRAEILAELPKLSVEDRAEIRAKLDELAGDVWLDDGELSEEDKRALDEAIAEYEKNPDAGSPWEEVEARIRAKLRS